MSIRSLFILNTVGEVIIEKHWRGLTSRQVVEHFISEISKAGDPADVPPVLPHTRYTLVHILHNQLYFLSVTESEGQSLMVIDFLTTVVNVFKSYFNDVSEETIKDNFTTCYEVLEEMADNGQPFLTELNALQDLVAPRGLGAIVREQVPTDLVPGQLRLGATVSATVSGSAVPWRRAGVKYSNNEMYIDVIEYLHVVVDSNQMMLSAEVNGVIEANSRLSGMPDLTLSFVNSRILDDVSLHPCVRLLQWEQSRVISFIPPDGRFQLLRYRSTNHIELPLYVKPQISWAAGASRITVMVGSKGGADSKPVEDVEIRIPFPKAVTGCTLTAPVGTVSYDDNTRVATWKLGKLPSQSPILTGSIHMSTTMPLPDSRPTLTVDFKVVGQSASGIKVDALTLHNETYKPWKGVRVITRGGHSASPSSGSFQVRA